MGKGTSSPPENKAGYDPGVWGGVAWATGSVRKGVAELESWAGWVWRVASLWLGNAAVIKLWVGF